MKKVLIIATVLLIAGTSCQKEGVYNPKEKISETYLESYFEYTNSVYPQLNGISENPKRLEEIWTWEKNKLTKIAHIYNNYDETFEYNGKRISKIKDSEGYTTTFTYDGDKIKYVEYKDDKMGGSTIFRYEYTGKKVSKITYTYTYDDWWDKLQQKGNSIAQQLILPCKIHDIQKHLQTKHKESKSKGVSTVTITFEWNGDNVSKMIYREDDGFYHDTYNTIYTYDDKLNPYYHYFFAEDDMFNLSKNNVIQSVITWVDEDGNSDKAEKSYTYEYDGKFPIQQTEIYKYSRSYYDYDYTYVTERNKNTYITYYKYK